MTDPLRPQLLLAATAAVALEGLALVGVGVWLLVSTLTGTPENEDVATGTTAYFLVLGALVLAVAWSLWRRHGWSAGPAVVVQLIALPIAVTMVQGGLWWGALITAAVAIAGLVGLLAPSSREALGR